MTALPLVRLLRRLRPIAGQATGAYVATILTTLAALAVPLVIRGIIDGATGARPDAFGWLPGDPGPRGRLLGGALVLVAIGVVRALLSFVQRYGTAWVGRTVATTLRDDVFAHVVRRESAFHDRASVGQLMTRLTSDVEQVRQFAATAAAEIVNIFVLVVGAAVILTAQDPGLALVAFAPMPVVAALAVVGARQLRPRFLSLQGIRGGLSARLQETLAQIRIVQAFVAERRTRDRYDTANEELYGARLGVARVFTTAFPAMNAVLGVGTAAVLWYGGRQVLAGTLSIGTLVAFMSYIGLIGQPVRRLGFLLNLTSRAGASASRIFELLDRPPTLVQPGQPGQPVPDRDQPVPDDGDPVPGRGRVAGARITWEHVTFSYAGEPVLRDVDLEVAPGEHVAIVGASGSGKSTLAALLLRLYEPDSGVVRLDGTDVAELPAAELRTRIGSVEQEAFLFSASVADNIRFSRPGATEDEIAGAARLAGADGFVSALPEGYATLVGERGVTLSGGQRQRIALARALLGRPDVLVLDDAVSAVDARTEERIRTALASGTGGQTVVSIAQRLSTVRAADRIVVLADGRVVQQGSHDELAQVEGPYAELLRIGRNVSGAALLGDGPGGDGPGAHGPGGDGPGADGPGGDGPGGGGPAAVVPDAAGVLR